MHIGSGDNRTYALILIFLRRGTPSVYVGGREGKTNGELKFEYVPQGTCFPSNDAEL